MVTRRSRNERIVLLARIVQVQRNGIPLSIYNHWEYQLSSIISPHKQGQLPTKLMTENGSRGVRAEVRLTAKGVGFGKGGRNDHVVLRFVAEDSYCSALIALLHRGEKLTHIELLYSGVVEVAGP